MSVHEPSPRPLLDLRQRVERILREHFGSAPTDATGDFMVALGEPPNQAMVWIRPELGADGEGLVRLSVVTNVDVRPDPELGRFLLETNAALPFGGLRLDPSRPAVVYADALLGDYLNSAELLVAVASAGAAALTHAPRVKQRFGGSLFCEI